jgi:hypothetical protein
MAALAAAGTASAEEILGTIEPVPAGDQQEVTFTSPGQVAKYSVPVSAGEAVSIEATEASLGATYRLAWLDAEGELMRTWWPDGEADAFFESTTFAKAGSATLVIEPQEETTGSVTLTLYDASDKSGGSVVPSPEGGYDVFSVDVPGQRALVTFDGDEGEQISIFPRGADFEGELHVNSPSGEAVSGSAGGGLEARHGPIELPEDGTYTIVLRGEEAQTGSVTLCVSVADEADPIDWCHLVAIYPLEEGEGEIAHDQSGDGHDGTIEGAEWIEGVWGSALEFDGEDDLVTVADDPELRLDDFTIDVWARPEEGAEAMPVVSKGSPSNWGYQLDVSGGSPGHAVARITYGGATESSVADDNDLEPGKWAHLIVTKAGDRLRLYVDGHLVDESETPVSGAGLGDLEIGGSTLGAEGSFFAGAIDELMIFDSALTTNQLRGLWGWEPSNHGQPILEGAAEETQPLSVRSNGDWKGAGPFDFSYQWERCPLGEECTPIAGANESTYFLTGADIGGQVRVVVEAANEYGSATEYSGYSRIVTTGLPWFAGAAEVVGQAEEGQELEVEDPRARGTAPLDVSYEWQRCYLSCEPIPGADEASYTATAADAAHMLRVRLTASNEVGENWSWSAPTDFVASVKAAGKPEASLPPRTAGLPRVTEELLASAGEWAGATPITTEVAWERCDQSGTECEEIAEATEPTYVVSIADEGYRLRIRETAANGSGTESLVSPLSDPIQPESNTVFLFEGVADIEELDDAVTEGELDWLGVTYGEEFASLFRIPPGTTNVVEELSDVLDEDASELPVASIELSGDVPTEALGTLEGLVQERQVIPSLHYANPAEPAARSLSRIFSPLPHFAEGVIGKAMLAGFNDSSEQEYVNGYPLLPDMDRGIYSFFGWESTPGETLTQIYESGSALAMEFDLKEINNDNTDLSIGGFTVECLPWERNNFWIGTHDPVAIRSDIPVEAGLYWDTAAEDPCTENDLTFGLYHPEYLEPEIYTTAVYFDGGDAVGDLPSSPFIWSVQILGEHCDTSPWCVNLPYIDITGASSPLISESEYFGGRDPGPAHFPGCYWYANPRHPLAAFWNGVLGPSACVEIS